MPGSSHHPRSRRLAAAGFAATLQAGILLVLISGLAPGHDVSAVRTTLNAFNLSPPPEPLRPVVKARPGRAASGKAAPANIRSRAAPVFAAPSPFRLKPLPAATTPATGTLATSGAARVAGPGTGAGGAGNGFGGGGDGSGTGGGSGGNGDGGDDAEWIAGRIGDRDYPQEARDAGAQGTVATEITIAPDGRPTGCRTTHSSGNLALDATTCRLVLKRFRFRPARDAGGRPTAGTVSYDQEWTLTIIPDE
jgi:protein TonB